MRYIFLALFEIHIRALQTTNDAGLVTASCIGLRVHVANLSKENTTTGILRFVGELEGQDGLYCGVELSESLGKNDGSYRGW